MSTRQRLLRAALELYTTAGFRATTTPMIAEHAGVAEGTIYRHFKSKEALLNEVYREAQRWATALLREEIARGLSAPETLRRFARRLVDAAAPDPGTVRMLLQHRDDAYLDDGSRAAAKDFWAMLHQVVAGGKSDGLVRAGAADLWASVWLAVIAYGTEQVCARVWTPDHPHVTATFDAAWAAIGTNLLLADRERTSSPAAGSADLSNPPAAAGRAPPTAPQV